MQRDVSRVSTMNSTMDHLSRCVMEHRRLHHPTISLNKLFSSRQFIALITIGVLIIPTVLYETSYGIYTCKYYLCCT